MFFDLLVSSIQANIIPT